MNRLQSLWENITKLQDLFCLNLKSSLKEAVSILILDSRLLETEYETKADAYSMMLTLITFPAMLIPV